MSTEVCVAVNWMRLCVLYAPTQTKPYKQAPTHPWQKSKFLSCCCGTKQQKQVSLVSINCQRSSCWILALYYSWRGCASCWQLGAMFISSTLCCHKHDGFQAFILKDVFSDSFFPFSLLWSSCAAIQTTATPFPFTFLLHAHVVWSNNIKSHTG